MEYYTNSYGHPVPANRLSIPTGAGGPVLTQNVQFLNKLARFNRERIPERIVHAKGTGAFGYFDCYQSLSNYTMASFLQGIGQRTKVFVRFSTSAGSTGSADTVRDARGFAVKFYTKDGIYDIVGNNIPVFFIRDASHFPDLLHCIRPAPDTGFSNPERFWDFFSMMPQMTHMITWTYSDHGTMKDYCHMDGFGVNTFIWVNRQGQRILVKYHFKTKQGVQTINRMEAERLAGVNPNIATQSLYDTIQNGTPPKWELCVQLMHFRGAATLDFNPLDVTKVWPEKDFPLIPIGLLTLNETPANYFAQVEQAAFCPGNIIPGIELTSDGILPFRAFGYTDTQRYRLGTNFAQLPINYPATKVCNSERDGQGSYMFNPDSINYWPNTLNQNQPAPYPLPEPVTTPSKEPLSCIPFEQTSDFKQAGERYRSLSDLEQAHLIDNIALDLCNCNKDIITKVCGYFSNADASFGELVAAAVVKYRTRRE